MVTREDFHYNFLKNVIIRLDFQGVLETEMDKVLVLIKPFAKERGFSKYVEKNTKQIDIAFTNNETPESIETTNKIRNQIVYSFIDENRGFALGVSNTFVCLQINTVHYVPFDEYCDIIPIVSDFYKNSIDFFSVTRFGIRKINECLIENKNEIGYYFNPSYFNFYNCIEEADTIQSNHVNIFKCGEYHVNLITNIPQGKFEGNPLYSVRLDIDTYLDKSEEILLLLSESGKMTEMNDLIFKIYTSSLTDKFISLLTSDDNFDNTIMRGVERND